MIEIEKEIKKLVSYEDYHMILNAMPKERIKSSKLQINYYYDTEGLELYYRNETLRIRQIGSDLRLEYKFDKSYQDNVRKCKESSQVVYILPSCIKTYGRKSSLKGQLVTRRHEYEYPGCLIALDESFYLGKQDYEVEIEITGNQYKLPKEIEGMMHHDSEAEGKYHRFIKQLNEIKKSDLNMEG